MGVPWACVPRTGLRVLRECGQGRAAVCAAACQQGRPACLMSPSFGTQYLLTPTTQQEAGGSCLPAHAPPL